MFFNKKNKARTIDTLIDKDISVRGNVTYSGGIRVDGSIQGTSLNFQAQQVLLLWVIKAALREIFLHIRQLLAET